MFKSPPGSQKPDFPFWGPRDYPADVLINIFQDECLLKVLEIKVRSEHLPRARIFKRLCSPGIDSKE
jgi:hypothetical protein